MFLSENRFIKSQIDPWQNTTIHMLQQALGSDSYGLYGGAFMNWQTSGITAIDDEEELYEEDARRALPAALTTLANAIDFLEQTSHYCPVN